MFTKHDIHEYFTPIKISFIFNFIKILQYKLKVYYLQIHSDTPMFMIFTGGTYVIVNDTVILCKSLRERAEIGKIFQDSNTKEP